MDLVKVGVSELNLAVSLGQQLGHPALDVLRCKLAVACPTEAWPPICTTFVLRLCVGQGDVEGSSSHCLPPPIGFVQWVWRGVIDDWVGPDAGARRGGCGWECGVTLLTQGRRPHQPARC